MKKHEPEIATPSAEEVAAYGGQQSDAEPTEAAAAAVPEEVQQWKDKFLRAKAEFANYQRRRAEKDHADALRYASAGLIRGLLSVIDDLERVLESAQKHPENAVAIIDGVKLTRDNFSKMLKQFGVEPIEAEGQPFDPQLHEALMVQPRSDVPHRTVVQQAARGYRLFDRVLRPAKVIVAKGTTDEEQTAEDEASGS